MEQLDLDEAMMRRNDWLGQRVRLLLLIPLEGNTDDPPSGPAEGWHIVLSHEGRLDHPKADTDVERQLTIGAYEIETGSSKLLLAELPVDRVASIGDSRLFFYLPGGSVVLTVQRLIMDWSPSP